MSSDLELNDELLCAYMDGELDQERRARVERALTDDAGARVRLERMYAADARLKAEIPVPAAAPSDPLAQHILTGAPIRQRTTPSSRWTVTLGALAAGIGGVVLGFVLSGARQRSSTAAFVPSSSSELLLSALEHAESGKVTSNGARTAQVILTFVSDDGRYCRAFRSRDVSGGAEGLACRDGEQWRLVAWDGTAATDDGFRTAGSSELLDDIMDRLGGGPALERSEEHALLERNWTAAR